jgi:hypothetical protein
MDEAVVQYKNGLFKHCIGTVGMRALGTGQTVDQSIGTVHLIVAVELAELLPGIPREFAGSAETLVNSEAKCSKLSFLRAILVSVVLLPSWWVCVVFGGLTYNPIRGGMTTIQNGLNVR